MDWLKSAEQVNLIVEEIVYTVPKDWRKIVHYYEILRGSDGSLRNKSLAICWCGSEMEKYSGPEIGGTVEAIEAIETLYENAVKNGDEWKGFLLVIHENGKFNSQFFYDAAPLLTNNDEGLKKILDSVDLL